MSDEATKDKTSDEITKPEFPQKPWYKRYASALVAGLLLALGALAGIAAVIGKTFLARKKVADAQKEDNKDLETRMADKDELAKAKLETVDEKTEAAKAKADAEHKEATHVLADKAKADEAANSGSADAASDALRRSLERANSKLQ